MLRDHCLRAIFILHIKNVESSALNGICSNEIDLRISIGTHVCVHTFLVLESEYIGGIFGSFVCKYLRSDTSDKTLLTVH